MEIIDLVFRGYFLLLLLRLTITDTGQAAFNWVFQFIVKATDPAIRPMGRIFPRGGRAAVIWMCLGLLTLIRGLLFLSSASPSLLFDLHLVRWSFNSDHSLWWLGKSFIYFFTVVFQFYAFILTVHRLWPIGLPGEESKRLIDLALEPLRFKRWGLGGLFLVFSLILAAIWFWFGFTGMLVKTTPSWWRAPLLAAALMVRLIPVIIYLIIAVVILGWLRMFGMGRWSLHSLESLVEVFLRPLRGLQLRAGTWDLTPLVAVLILYFLERMLMELLTGIYRVL